MSYNEPNQKTVNRRQLIRSLALTAVGIPASMTGTVHAATDANATGTKGDSLRLWESKRYDSELKITFLNVTEDSRCPINARCISPGNAEVVLRVKAGNQPAKNHRLNTHGKPCHLVIPANVFPPGMVGIPKSFGIKIDSLLPLPIAGVKTNLSDYRLRLGVTVAV